MHDVHPAPHGGPVKEIRARSLTVAGLACAVLLAWSLPVRAQGAAVDTSQWDAYLDYAYVYVSADAAALGARLDEYASQAGMTLDEYATVAAAGRRPDDETIEEATRRRLAVAHLLRYLATREPKALERSVELIAPFEEHEGRHESLYWYHTVLAHRALEKGNSHDFTRHVLQLWLDVVVPLESPYETLQALSLDQSTNSGFVSALPYVYENVSRMILIRSQEMGIHSGLDPLAAIVRMLAQGRVGGHPDVIPVEASSREYLDRILSRLDGAESDGGSLTFTLVLFEAGKHHDQARALLAQEGLSDRTVKAMAVASGAYQKALDLAQTLQGQAVVYTRVLRQLGEVWAAKQRLGVDPYVEMPFSIDGAIRVWQDLFAEGRGDEWAQLGFRRTGFESYVLTLQTLWQEIQEASLNAADYYLTRSVADPVRAGEHARSAARIDNRYLAFFTQFATTDGADFVPDSAYFAAYEAARGYGDAFLVYAPGSPSADEVDYAVDRYHTALRLFPFDRTLWSAYASALERQGRSNQFLSRVRPIADGVARSRHIDAWIQAGEPGSQALTVLRAAMSDELAVMYLGFANAAEIPALEASLDELRDRRDAVERDIVALGGVTGDVAPPAARAEGDGSGTGESVVERAERGRRIEEARRLLDKLDKQLASRSRALPLYRATLETDGLIDALRAQRNHPVHTLLRRIHYETRP
jgi:hypothetical protein